MRLYLLPLLLKGTTAMESPNENLHYKVTIEKFGIYPWWIPLSWLPGCHHTELKIHNVVENQSLIWGFGKGEGRMTAVLGKDDVDKKTKKPLPRFFKAEDCSFVKSIHVGWIPKKSLELKTKNDDRDDFNGCDWYPYYQYIYDENEKWEEIYVGKKYVPKYLRIKSSNDDLLYFKKISGTERYPELENTMYEIRVEQEGKVKDFVKKWKPKDYRLLSKNCNCFSKDVVKFLKANCDLNVTDESFWLRVWVWLEVSSLNSVPSLLALAVKSHIFEILSGVAFWRVLKAHTWTWFTPVLAAGSLLACWGCCKLRKFLQEKKVL